MSLRDFLIFLIRQILFAAGAVIVVLLGLEWLMPGSVLPFFDLMDLMPWLALFFVIMLLTVERKPGLQTVLSLIFGLLTVICLLAMVAARLTDRWGMGLLPMIAGMGMVTVWFIAALRSKSSK